ncbi:MAG: carbon starvation protein A, partial [Opitutales bacterium]|nr:carbon starvation protein A [Opitutales bacterium]
MILFFIGLFILVAGYFTYGKFVERVIGPDSRQTPANTMRDGVDYVTLPHWKNMLIQLLNIAGVGPVIGVIIGIKFGEWVFLIIPIGNIIAGATHDFLAGMMSIRNKGANLPKIVKDNLGSTYSKFFSVFTIVLLLLVVTVFINIPADLFNKLLPEAELFWFAVGTIFFYYITATLFPIDKIIGKFYPLFGAMLLIGTFVIFLSMLFMMVDDVDMLTPSTEFLSVQWDSENGHPIIPLLFVTIACGIISGFHATQSPIIART